MKKLIYIFFFTSMACLFIGCSDVEDWLDPMDDNPPGTISNPTVANFPGGARITYTLPSDADLLGVKAVYSYAEDGETLEAFASAFSDTLKLDGFPDTSERTVQLICLDKSKNESAPVEVKIQPLTPPVDLIRESLKVNETFGGVFVSWVNEYKADIGISLYAADSTGEMVHNYTYYTNEAKGNYSFRGLDDTERKFEIQIRDKWDRFSIPLDTVLKPKLEVEITPQNEGGMVIWEKLGASDGMDKWRGDAVNLQNPFNRLFDGNPDNFFGAGNTNKLSDYTDNSDDESTELVPIYLTIDLNKECSFSRHKVWHRPKRVLSNNQIKKYELWATNEPPKGKNDFSNIMESLAFWTSWPEVGGTDAWKNDWDKIATCETIPPSGATSTTAVTEEDKQWANAHGFEFEIDPEFTNQSYRYVRLVVIERTWTNSTNLHIGNIKFWGAYTE